jgi:hypothetical protein
MLWLNVIKTINLLKYSEKEKLRRGMNEIKKTMDLQKYFKSKEL